MKIESSLGKNGSADALLIRHRLTALLMAKLRVRSRLILTHRDSNLRLKSKRILKQLLPQLLRLQHQRSLLLLRAV
jgi:hypothetical protein